ncbi:NAD(P)-binding protein [Athelia psychrophila]|uniref:NAD(P)-binding protein n=1 Tax=Athelia psychrophila TaxID=1759441 RepID=A0A166Q9K7_9AGAM|nr:NAD(P)-binding protein [Fibularhizoctonia sp. CBS 109695]
MPALSEARSANASFSTAYLPVALFVGGTSGIGRATAEAFARSTKGHAHIVIVGRNRQAGEAVLASFPQAATSRYEFVQCDVSLMQNVHATAAALRASLPKLNYLMASPGLMTLSGRDETAEGIDKKLAVDYYARWTFVKELVPLLRNAKDAGEDAKVLTLLAAGEGGNIDLDNLGLKRGYSLPKAMEAAATYNDLMIETFAAQQPDMAFTHMFPGLVRTGLTKPAHWALAPVWPVMQALMYPFSISAADSAEYVLHALLEGEKGFFRRGPQGQLLKNEGKGYFATEEAKTKLWDHTVEATTVV